MAIDEKKLIDDLKGWMKCLNKKSGADNTRYDLLEEVIDLIEEQPKLSLENKTSDKWIQCSERLPDEHENYIVTVCDECNLIWAETVVVLAEYFEGSWLWYEGGKEYDITDMVIAWMPLPPAYKGKE